MGTLFDGMDDDKVTDWDKEQAAAYVGMLVTRHKYSSTAAKMRDWQDAIRLLRTKDQRPTADIEQLIGLAVRMEINSPTTAKGFRSYFGETFDRVQRRYFFWFVDVPDDAPDETNVSLKLWAERMVWPYEKYTSTLSKIRALQCQHTLLQRVWPDVKWGLSSRWLTRQAEWFAKLNRGFEPPSIASRIVYLIPGEISVPRDALKKVFDDRQIEALTKW